MAVGTIRGAITVEENSRESVLKNTEMLLTEILKKNNLVNEDIVSIVFSATKDITAVYPAVAARALGITEASLMCLQEMYVEGSLPLCIRIMVTIETHKKQRDMEHVYLKKAEKLRPDLIKGFAVAIDGPSGAGKSTIAKLLAKELGYIYIDTGAMYRAFALHCVREGITIEKAVEGSVDIELKYVDGEQRIYLKGEDVSKTIRTQEIAEASAKVAIVKEVRKKLVKIQRELAKGKKVIMDGRDIGTCVLPNADVKIYLDAGVENRTARRVEELNKLGKNADYETVKKEIEDRDYMDMNREVSPLRKADDAIEVDTSQMNIEQVKDKLLKIILQG